MIFGYNYKQQLPIASIKDDFVCQKFPGKDFSIGTVPVFCMLL